MEQEQEFREAEVIEKEFIQAVDATVAEYLTAEDFKEDLPSAGTTVEILYTPPDTSSEDSGTGRDDGGGAANVKGRTAVQNAGSDGAQDSGGSKSSPDQPDHDNAG